MYTCSYTCTFQLLCGQQKIYASVNILCIKYINKCDIDCVYCTSKNMYMSQAPLTMPMYMKGLSWWITSCNVQVWYIHVYNKTALIVNKVHVVLQDTYCFSFGSLLFLSHLPVFCVKTVWLDILQQYYHTPEEVSHTICFFFHITWFTQLFQNHWATTCELHVDH